MVEVITSPPYHFSIDADASVAIIAKNVKVEVLKGQVSIATNTFENGHRIDLDEPFQYQIFDKEEQHIKEFEMTSKAGDIKEFSLTAGEYTIVQRNDTAYALDRVEINGTMQSTSPYSFIVDQDGHVSITFDYAKSTIDQGILSFTTTLFANGQQLYNDTMFEYQILNTQGDILMKFSASSQQQLKELLLPM